MIAKVLREYPNGLTGPMLWHHVNLRFNSDFSYKRVRNILLFLRRLGYVRKVGCSPRHKYILTEEGERALEEWIKILRKGVEAISAP